MSKQGFTLIETIIYIAILAFLIGSGITAAFYIIDSSGKNKTDINIQAEGHFLLRKIDWVLTGATVITVPASGSHGAVLQTNKGGVGTVLIDAVSGRARISVSGGPALEITSSRVNVQNINFMHVAVMGSRPEEVEASSTINGQSLTITKYLRK